MNNMYLLFAKDLNCEPNKSGVLCPKITLKVNNSAGNIIKILQGKTSLLEKFISKLQ